VPYPPTTGHPLAARVSPTEAAEIVDRHVDTIYSALAAKELCGDQRVAGGRWRIYVDCLAAWDAGRKCDHQLAASNVVPFPGAPKAVSA
jgi:hypothetical protein